MVVDGWGFQNSNMVALHGNLEKEVKGPTCFDQGKQKSSPNQCHDE
jgi:hypothetical protein